MKIGKDDLVVVTGGGGFIGGHLIADLRRQGLKRLRSVDVKPFDEWYQRFPDVESLQLDLKEKEACWQATKVRRYSGRAATISRALATAALKLSGVAQACGSAATSAAICCDQASIQPWICATSQRAICFAIASA